MAARRAAAETTQTSIPGTEPTAEEVAAAKERKRNKPLAMADAVKRVLDIDRKADERRAEVEKTMRANFESTVMRALGKVSDKAKTDADAILARVPEADREVAERVVRAARSAVAHPEPEAKTEEPAT